MLKQIAENKLTIGKKIGNGHLGDVNEGFLKVKNKTKALNKNEKNQVKVAVKVSFKFLKFFIKKIFHKKIQSLRNKNDELAVIDFLKEAIYLSKLKDENIVRFYGISFENSDFYKPKLILIEYMNRGDLLHFIRNFRVI